MIGVLCVILSHFISAEDLKDTKKMALSHLKDALFDEDNFMAQHLRDEGYIVQEPKS